MKRSMIRALSLVFALLLALGMFSACGQTDTYKVLDENFGTEKYAIGFRKGDNTLTLKVQSILDEMLNDGTSAEISKKWFGVDNMLKGEEFPREIVDEGDDSLQKVLDKGTLILGLDVGFEPMGYYDENNNIVGFDIDLATEVAKRLGVELVLQPISWDAKEMELSGGNIDMIWNGMSVTDERVEGMNISKPYLANRMIIITKDGSGINSKADLAGKVIGVQAGSSAVDAIDAEPDVKATFKSMAPFETNPAAFMDLKAGRVDAMVVDEVVGLNLIDKMG